MRLKLDENLSTQAAALFRAADLDATTVPDQSLEGADDEIIADVCRREERCLVTLDMGFANPFVFRPSEHAGIAVLRLPGRPTHKGVLGLCRGLVGALKRDNIGGRLWIVEPGRIREYRPDPAVEDA